MALTQDQEDALTRQGACYLHYHPDDQTPTHVTLRQMQALVTFVNITGTAYTVGPNDDIIKVDTTAATSTITLPSAIGGIECIVIKTVAANTVHIAPSGTDTILGAAVYDLTAQWAVARLKADSGNWLVL